MIQSRLVALGHHTIGIPDWIWGDRTTAAVKAMQEPAARTNPAIVPDGHYGPRTKGLLEDDANRAVVSATRKAVTAADLAATRHAVGNNGQGIAGIIDILRREADRRDAEQRVA